MTGSTPAKPSTRRPYGQTAWFIDLPDTLTALGFRRAMDSDPLPGLIQAVAGEKTVLLEFDTVGSRDAAAAAVDRHRQNMDMGGAPAPSGPSVPIEIPIRYDGEDLPEVAGLLGITEQDVVRRHASVDYVVAFAGFTPGFGYLVPATGPGLPPVPRRASARTSVPVGSLGLAGSYSGIYPRSSPGGWQLIGRANVSLWDATRHPPALLQPGAIVRFQAVSTLPDLAERMPPRVPETGSAPGLTGAGIEILRSGILATAQDLGRPGLASLGVPRSGAADRESAVLANRLAGNPDDAAVVETTLGRFRFRVRGHLRLAVTGAPTTLRCLDRPDVADPAGTAHLVRMRPNSTWEIGKPNIGLRNYLAVTGGWSFPRELNSCATDLLSGLGPPALSAGQFISVTAGAEEGAGRSAAPAALYGPSRVRPPARPLESGAVASNGVVPLEVVPGPREDWVVDWRALSERDFVVTINSNRVGLRLHAHPPMMRKIEPEMASEPMLPGAVQIPPDGQPVIFLADCPVTGGYPVIAVLTADSLRSAAQLGPGTRVRFVFTDGR